MWTEAIVAKFEVLFRHLHRGAEENQEEPRSE
jgi:hypothetical protein